MSAALTNTEDALGRVQALLAATLWAEASTRPVRAMEALAALAVNRARAAVADEAARLRYAPGAPPLPEAAWALLLVRVCRAPFLFGCWNPRDTRHALLRDHSSALLRDATDDPARAIARRIAARAAAGTLPDPTAGATHWHDARVLPGWAVGRIPCAEVAGLVLYRLTD